MFPIWACWMVAPQVPNGIWETLLHPPIDVIIRLHKWLLCAHCQAKRQMLLVSQSIFPHLTPPHQSFNLRQQLCCEGWKPPKWVKTGKDKFWEWVIPGYFPADLECTWTDPQVDIPTRDQKNKGRIVASSARLLSSVLAHPEGKLKGLSMARECINHLV